jgi:hypothetical protein
MDNHLLIDKEQLESEIKYTVSYINILMEADEKLFKYYKNLPNAHEWSSFMRKDIDDSLIRSRKFISDGTKILTLISNGNDYQGILEDSYNSFGVSHLSIDLAARIIDETLIGDCTDLIINAIIVSEIEYVRLLITRREAFIYDDVFEIMENFPKLVWVEPSLIKLIESTVTAALKN